VVVEKSFTTSAAEAIELAELSAAKHLKLSVFQNRRWDSDFKTVKKIIEEGWLGEILEAEIHFDRYNPLLSPKLHKEIPRPGSGILFDLGPHLIDQALCLFGMPESVFADLRITRQHSSVHDYFELILFYPELRVRLKSGYFVREAFPAYVIHGRQGSFHKSRGDVQEICLNDNIKPDRSDWGTEPVEEEGLLHTEKDGQIIRKKSLRFREIMPAIMPECRKRLRWIDPCRLPPKTESGSCGSSMRPSKAMRRRLWWHCK